MAGVLPATGTRGGLLGQFEQRRPRLAGFLGDNSSALMQFGMGLLSGGNRGEAWANASQGLAYGSQADQARRQRTQEEEEQARQQEAVNQLLMSPEFAELPEAYRTMLTADPELARSFVASQLENRFAPQQGPDPTDDMREYEFARSQGFTGSFQEWQMQRPPSTVINNGPTGIDYGQPPTDHAWARNPDGTVQIDERGAPIALPVGTAYTEQQAAAEAAAAAATTADANTTRQTSVLLTNIDGAMDLAEQPLTTGFAGNLAAALPGTPAYDLRAKVDTIKAIIGFQTLQEMRDASTTGAALGQITERELAFLQATWGNLDPNQSYGAFVEQLNAARQITMDIVEGRQTVDASGQVVPQSVVRQGGAAAAPATAPAPPAPGTVMDGYRFNGGDPADPNNWTRVP